MRKAAIATGLAAALAAVGAGFLLSAGPAGAGPAPQAASQPAQVAAVVRVRMGEMYFKFSTRRPNGTWGAWQTSITLPRGTTEFRVVYVGVLPHDFVLRGLAASARTRVLEKGQRQTVRIRFPKANSHSFLCTVEGHAAAGMLGRLKVKAS